MTWRHGIAVASRRRRGGLLLALLLALTACRSPQYAKAVPSPQATFPQGFHAGVATVDITPPPGLAMFGHGPEGRIAMGTLLRLRCQAFALSQTNDAIVLLTCDLAAPSLQLQRAVARRVVAQGVPLGADRILLMATHTHAGPAHYFGARNYSGSFSSRAPGYDPQVVQFLAERMATAVRLAWARRKPACANWASMPVRSLTRNRSYPAFAANPSLRPSVAEQLRPRALDRALSPAQHAVDSTLTVLRIDRQNAAGGQCADPAEHTPMGLLSVFGMHPTAVANTNELYHGDVFGYAVRAIHDHPSLAEHPELVAGMANGIEGDVSPAWDYQAPREARRLGKALAGKIVDLYHAAGLGLSSAFPIRHAYRELVFSGHLAEDDTPFYRNLGAARWDASFDGSKRPRKIRLCAEPEIGTAAAGGAEDGPTRMRIFPEMNEGFRASQPGPCHGFKFVVRAPTGRNGSDGLEFPAVAPISLVRLGSAVLATVPAELTTVVGLRLRDRLRTYLKQEAHAAGVERVVVAGLTNAYMQYVTTKPEYALQHYEGASTLYGPDSARFLGNQLLCLGRWLFAEPRYRDQHCRLDQPHEVNASHRVAFDPLKVTRLQPDPDELPEVLELKDLTVTDAPTQANPAWKIHWRGVPPAYVRHPERLMVSIEIAPSSPLGRAGAQVDDDGGSNISVRHDDGTWTARWAPDARDCQRQQGRSLRFVVRGLARLTSQSFSVDCGGGGSRSGDWRSR